MDFLFKIQENKVKNLQNKLGKLLLSRKSIFRAPQAKKNDFEGFISKLSLVWVYIALYIPMHPCTPPC